MAGVLKSGEVFATGEVVTAARLNRMVDEGTILGLGIDGDMIQSGAIVERHLNASLTLSPALVAVSPGKLLAGDATGSGTELTPDPAEFVISASTLSLKTGGVAAGKLAGGILESQLAGSIGSNKLTAVGTAGTYGDATHVPRITLDSAGRATAIVSTEITGAAWVTFDLTLPVATPSQGATATYTFSKVPTVVNLQYIAQSGVADGYAANDLIPWSSVVWEAGGWTYPAYVVWINGTVLNVYRSQTNVQGANATRYRSRTDGTGVAFPAGSWKLRIAYA